MISADDARKKSSAKIDSELNAILEFIDSKIRIMSESTLNTKSVEVNIQKYVNIRSIIQKVLEESGYKVTFITKKTGGSQWDSYDETYIKIDWS